MSAIREQMLEKQRQEIISEVRRIKNEACSNLREDIAEILRHRSERREYIVHKNLGRIPKTGYHVVRVVTNYSEYVYEQREMLLRKYGQEQIIDPSLEKNDSSF